MFPNELFEHIFQFLKEDSKDLQAVALSGRRFLPIAQRYIFSSIKLHTSMDHSGQKQSFLWRRLLAVLDGNPFLGNFVQTLHLIHLSMSAHNSIQLEDEELPRLLLYFTNLRSLNFTIVKKKWDILPQSLTNAFRVLLTADTLRCCTIRFLRGIPITIFHNSKIEELSLLCTSLKELPSNMIQDPKGQVKERNHDPRPKLRLFEARSIKVEDEIGQYGFKAMSITRTGNMHGINRSKLSLGFDFTHLHTLCLDLKRVSDEVIDLLTMSKDSLNHLTLKVRDKPKTGMDLSVVTNLQSLTIAIYNCDNVEVVLSASNTLIRTISPRNFKLKVITFSLRILHEELLEYSASFEALDATLFQIHQINGLSEGIRIRTEGWIARDESNIFLLLQQYMCNCNNAGLLHYVQK